MSSKSSGMSLWRHRIHLCEHPGLLQKSCPDPRERARAGRSQKTQIKTQKDLKKHPKVSRQGYLQELSIPTCLILTWATGPNWSMRGWDEQKGLMVQEQILIFWSPEWFGSYSLKPVHGQWEDCPSFPGWRGTGGDRMVLFKELSPNLKSQIPAPAPSPCDPQLLLIFKGWAEGSGCSKGIPPRAPSPLPSAGEG